MTVQSRIEGKLTEALKPSHLQVINESHMHSVPPGSESHFKLVVVTDSFEAVPHIRRHQTVNGILREELAGPLHALSMETLTPVEWAARDGAVRASPDCHGGGKTDA